MVTEKDLSRYLGHRISVRGKATDMGDAKVKMESRVATSGSMPGSEKQTDKAKTELTGETGLHYLGVDSVKTVAKSCA